MKNSLLLVSAVLLVTCFTQCKKKDATTLVVPPNTLTVTSLPTENLVVSSGMFTDSGKTYYGLEGIDISGVYPQVNVTMAQKPTSNYSVTFPNTAPGINVSLYDKNNTAYTISNGVVSVNIVNSSIVVSFFGVLFTSHASQDSLLVNGSMAGN